MFDMHPPEARQQAMDLIAQGVNDCEISRRLGIPRPTIRDWRAPRYVKRARADWERCPRCGRFGQPMTFSDEDYAELLGLYLGDGTITELPRTQKLRIHFDAKYPRLIAEYEALLRRSMPRAKTGRVSADEGAMVVAWTHSQHLACLLPQHGPGKKHDRPIILEPWQEDIVRRAPWSLLRGLIRSDGCVFMNRTGKYVYESYDFANYSQDILDLFCATCDLVGVEYKRYPRHVRICRRPSVAKMLENVGRKS